jgi:hypothetical protein
VLVAQEPVVLDALNIISGSVHSMHGWDSSRITPFADRARVEMYAMKKTREFIFTLRTVVIRKLCDAFLIAVICNL